LTSPPYFPASECQIYASGMTPPNILSYIVFSPCIYYNISRPCSSYKCYSPLKNSKESWTCSNSAFNFLLLCCFLKHGIALAKVGEERFEKMYTLLSTRKRGEAGSLPEQLQHKECMQLHCCGHESPQKAKAVTALPISCQCSPPAVWWWRVQLGGGSGREQGCVRGSAFHWAASLAATP